ncbi:hypothetical protein EAI89_22965 [Eubacterium sp. am_0171]|uniref:phosphotransferase n=1 Tax=unclassified Eubacterium (in: firmicutes) TaxID=2624479 RepID=UPI00101F0A40|nr:MULTISPECIES: phosphotransferase [unclassified Eubacterium (in: firmicutes)]MSC86653.1 phosphotransferase [Eubacterium sp. BIOML-A1]MSD08856.1 phosphotransferase [Eubacterium sp. BIOML-A2]RYT10865.1 hypothetical protein EAI89_22965 [Eubacterium sp. am_0171]
MDKNEFCEIFRQLTGARAESCIEITQGNSSALKYKVSSNGHHWMAKMLEASTERIRWYNSLAEIHGLGLAIPDMYITPDESKLLLLSPFINGTGLDSLIEFSNPTIISEYGRQAAMLMKRLHHRTLINDNYSEDLKARVDQICNTVMMHRLSFPGLDACIDFVKSYSAFAHPGKLGALHRDVRPENFVVGEKGLSLIDFENGCVGELEADFVYLTTMGETKHRHFAKSLLLNYMDGCVTSEFWGKNLFYSTLQVMEYAVWKWETKQKQISCQAHNLMIQYNSLKSIEPLWWNEV